MITDCFILSWPYTLLSIFTIGLIGSHGSVTTAYNEVKRTFWPAMKATWVFYPVTLVFLYGFVPPILRAFVGTILRGTWGTLLSYIYHHDPPEE